MPCCVRIALARRTPRLDQRREGHRACRVARQALNICEDKCRRRDDEDGQRQRHCRTRKTGQRQDGRPGEEKQLRGNQPRQPGRSIPRQLQCLPHISEQTSI
jgi:hypothetical protein